MKIIMNNYQGYKDQTLTSPSYRSSLVTPIDCQSGAKPCGYEIAFEVDLRYLSKVLRNKSIVVQARVITFTY